MFKTFLAYIEIQFSTGIKLLRADCGGEYKSYEFKKFILENGIISESSCPYTPKQNGVPKLKICQYIDVSRTLLIESSIPSKYWVEALSIVFY